MRRAFAAAARLQFLELRSRPDSWLPLVTAPIASLTVSAILLAAERPDIAHIAIVGPGLMAALQFTLFEGAEVLSQDRVRGVLEPLAATPSAPVTVVAGRASVIALLSLLAFAESAAVTILVTGLNTELHHPVMMVVVLAATFTALVGFTMPLTAVLMMRRGVRVIQNTLPWPLFLLGGILVPTTFLPDWLQPLSGAIFLTPVASLLRATFEPAPVEGAVGGILLILAWAVLLALVGLRMHRRAMAQLRTDGGLALE